MGKRKKEGKLQPSVFERARNELFSQIQHCGVLEATEEQREAWFEQTMDYLARRYPDIGPEELARLSELGRRYCQPVISHGGRAEAHTEGNS